MVTKGPRVLNCRGAAANGTAVASRTPRKGIKFRNAHDPQRDGSFHSENQKYHRRTRGHNGSDDKVSQHKSADHTAKTTDELGNIDSAFEHIDEANIHLVFCDQHEKYQEGKYTSHDQDTGYRSDASN